MPILNYTTVPWYVVTTPWLPPDTEPYIVAGSPDPQAALQPPVCDAFPIDDWDDEPDEPDGEFGTREEQMALRYELLEHICKVHNETLRQVDKILND